MPLREGQTGTAPDGTRVIVRNGQVVPIAPKMPVGINNSVRAELDQARGANTVNTILGRHRRRIESGDLNLGPVANVIAPIRNLTGFANANSRNFQSLRSDLERMRNQSLRLNSGPQTEGDAQRAWKELFQNLTDEGFVTQRMGEIEQSNQQAIDERRGNIDSMRMQYGYPEISDRELFPQTPTRSAPLPGIGAPLPPTSPLMAGGSSGTIRRYNPATGRIE